MYNPIRTCRRIENTEWESPMNTISIAVPQNRSTMTLRRVVIAAMVLCGASSLRAQLPDSFTNLKVLPPDIGKGELMGTMKGFCAALDLRCVNCHVGDDQKGFSSFDFASDEKELKVKARGMVEMVREINARLLPALSTHSKSGPAVQCMTCHRGQSKPYLISDVLQLAWDEGQGDAVIERFRELRSEYYGAHTFDFSERVLLRFAGRIGSQDNTEAALKILALNLEYFPESAMTHFSMSDAYVAAGRKDLAIESLEKAVELMPGTPFLERKLQQLKGE